MTGECDRGWTIPAAYWSTQTVTNRQSEFSSLSHPCTHPPTYVFTTMYVFFTWELTRWHFISVSHVPLKHGERFPNAPCFRGKWHVTAWFLTSKKYMCTTLAYALCPSYFITWAYHTSPAKYGRCAYVKYVYMRERWGIISGFIFQNLKDEGDNVKNSHRRHHKSYLW